jgi:hypothetical protein
MIDTAFSLSLEDQVQFGQLLRESGFLSPGGGAIPETTLGLDGAQWVLEWAGHGRYYSIDRWSPEPRGPAAAYRRLGEWLLHRSSLAPDSLVAQY